LIAHSGIQEHAYVDKLEAMIAKDHLQAGPVQPAAWANESMQIAKQVWVKPHTEIDQAYYDREISVVDHQLALAGLRLAEILNQELGSSKKV
jgi:hypothetical protein